jgi:hypothetical protein
MLSQRFGVAMRRILARKGGGLSDVDTHSLRRSFAQSLRDAMEAGSSTITTTLIGSLMGHRELGLALSTYSAKSLRQNLDRAIAEMHDTGLAPEVRVALTETVGQRPAQLRTAPMARPQVVPRAMPASPPRRGRPPNSVRARRASSPSP